MKNLKINGIDIDKIIRANASKVINKNGTRLSTIEWEDLYQVGYLTVLRMWDKIDFNHPHIKSYLNIRIRGAMIDEFRRMDFSNKWQRPVYDKVKEFIHEYYGKYGVYPDLDTIVEKTGLERNRVKNVLNDDVINEITHYGEQLNYIGKESFEDEVDRKLMVEKIWNVAEKQLKPIEIIVLREYYKNNKSMKQIAKIINKTETRVSQIHKEALHKIRNKIQGMW